MVEDFRDLRTYQHAFEASHKIFELSKHWPKVERYALTDQIRRASRSVCANMAEAWSKRLYIKHFTSKLSDAHAEASETTVWIDYAFECGYLTSDEAELLRRRYRRVIGGLIKMINQAEKWCGPSVLRDPPAPYDINA